MTQKQPSDLLREAADSTENAADAYREEFGFDGERQLLYDTLSRIANTQRELAVIAELQESRDEENR